MLDAIEVSVVLRKYFNVLLVRERSLADATCSQYAFVSFAYHCSVICMTNGNAGGTASVKFLSSLAVEFTAADALWKVYIRPSNEVSLK